MISNTGRIIIDAREFVQGNITGIGRVLWGLIDALAKSNFVKQIVLAVKSYEAVPKKFVNGNRIRIIELPKSFIQSEKRLSDLSKAKASLLISPYPKLPIFGSHCLAVHTIHDVLDLTHPAYRKRFKVYFDIFRLKKALARADLTWYDSSSSKNETHKLAGKWGNNPRVRFPGLDEKFNTQSDQNAMDILKKFSLQPGYILVAGNGLPHKNLGVLLQISDRLKRPLVCVGVSQANQKYWQALYPGAKTLWIEHIEDEAFPSIVRNAFCLAQPSTAEGFGYPPLEAMACGVPAVVSDIAVLVETTGSQALVADRNDSQAWIKAFDDLEDSGFYQNRVKKGLQWVKPFLGREGWKKHLSDLVELLKGNLYEKGSNHRDYRTGR